MQREVILCFPLKKWGPLSMLQFLVSFWGIKQQVYHRLVTELLMMASILHVWFTTCLFAPNICCCARALVLFGLVDSFMVLIKLIECNQEGGKGTHMWTGARMLGSQGCFSSWGIFFTPVLFSISVACISEDLAEMCREQRRESVACFVSQCCSPDCLWETK